jgi:hypothetical protein
MFGIPSGVATKYSERPSAENSGLLLRPVSKPASARALPERTSMTPMR